MDNPSARCYSRRPPSSLFANLGAWAYFLIIFGILFGAFTVIIALDEAESALRETRVVLKALAAAIAVLTAFGFAATLIGYIDPGMALTSAEFRIIPLREISAEELGYTPDEGVMLLGLGILWKSLAAFVYLAVVVGGHLALAIRRATSAGDTPAPPAAPPVLEQCARAVYHPEPGSGETLPKGQASL